MARLDPELLFLLYQHKEATEPGQLPTDSSTADEAPPLQIAVHFVGTSDALEAAGMQVVSVVGPVAYGQISVAALNGLTALDAVQSISKLRRDHTLLNDSVPDIRANAVWSRAGSVFTNGGQGAIVGIIDTGIEYRSLNFRRADGTTRLLRLWDQTLTPAAGEATPTPVTLPSGTNPANPAKTVPLNYGVEYTEKQISDFLANDSVTPKIRHEDADGHGSHVAGIAAGSGVQRGRCHGTYTYVGVAPAADLIVVRKWGLTEGDKKKPLPTNTGTASTTIDAIMYILGAAKVAQKPVVINMSFGLFSDLMDGTSPDSLAMDALLKANSTGFTLVFGAGNDGDSAFHAKADVPADPATSLLVTAKIKGDDSERRHLKINYTGANLKVRLKSDEDTTPWVASTDPPKSFANNANGKGTVLITNQAGDISITLNPVNKGNNIDGDWILEVQTTAATPAATPVDAFWLYGSSHDGKSPYFKNHVSVQSTLITQASTIEAISVGAYPAGSTNTLAGFSSRGPTLDQRTKPDITAPGVSIVSTDSGDYRGCCNWLCCRCCFYKNLDGTSMAAPHVAGAVALLFQKNKTLTHVQVKDHLRNGARIVQPLSIDDRLGWGAGKLDVKAAHDHVPAPTPAPPAPVAEPAPTPFAMLPQSQADWLEQRVVSNPRWPAFRASFDRFADEILALVDTNKRVATVWHRSGGPAWVRVAMQLLSLPTMPIPAAAGGCTLHEGISRMQAILERYGSEPLRRELAHYQPDINRIDSGLSLLQVLTRIEQAQQPTPASTY